MITKFIFLTQSAFLYDKQNTPLAFGGPTRVPPLQALSWPQEVSKARMGCWTISGSQSLNWLSMFHRVMQLHYPESMWILTIAPDECLVGQPVATKSIFHNPCLWMSSNYNITFHLITQSNFSNLSIDKACQHFLVNNLQAALGDFFSGHSYISRNGCPSATSSCTLPFSHLHVWNKNHIQQNSTQNPLSLCPTQTIQALPASPALPFGHTNTVLILHKSGDPISADSKCALTQLSLVSTSNILFSYKISHGSGTSDTLANNCPSMPTTHLCLTFSTFPMLIL